MIYDYSCGSCGAKFDVVKPMSLSSRKEKCPECKKPNADRVWSKSLSFIGTAVQHPEYNPAFGKVVKNSYHRSELAKMHNVEEIGNESPASIHKHFDSERERRREKRWNED